MRCCLCGESKEESSIVITASRKIVCKSCEKYHTDYHFNTFKYERGRVVEETPFDNISEEKQRYLLIDFIHVLFSDEVAKTTYSQVQKFRNDYTYLQIIRALEYFFIIKKGDIQKSKGSIGIVPYIIKDSEAYYRTKNNFLKNRFSEQVKTEESKTKVIEGFTQKVKGDKINLNEI